jgi:glycosyltransferase involved in cell wall biosynthesis
MSTPVSVVMAVYNGRKYLLQQLESVLSQLEPADELIIVDDGSRDDSVALVRSLNDPRIRLFVNDVNRGVIGTFDRGLGLALHPVVFLSDQDDIWMPGKRAAFAAEFARDPQVSVVISDAAVIDGDGVVRSKSYFNDFRGGFAGGVLATLWRSRYLGCAMAVRSSVLRAALPIPRKVPMHDMWLGALATLSGKVIFLPEPFLRYRRHTHNASPITRASLWRILRWRFTLATLLMRRCLGIRLGLHRQRAAGS